MKQKKGSTFTALALAFLMALPAPSVPAPQPPNAPGIEPGITAPPEAGLHEDTPPDISLYSDQPLELIDD